MSSTPPIWYVSNPMLRSPRWLARWEGKRVYADGHEGGDVRLQVIKGRVDAAATDAVHRVDGLSGATLTANGVTGMVHYWLGRDGYGPFLERLRNGGI